MDPTLEYILVACSLLLGGLASYTALDLVSEGEAATGRARRLLLASAAVALAMGLWSAHLAGVLVRAPEILLDAGPVFLALPGAIILCGGVIGLITLRGKSAFALPGAAVLLTAASAALLLVDIGALQATRTTLISPVLQAVLLVAAAAATWGVLLRAPNEPRRARSRNRLAVALVATTIGAITAIVHHALARGVRFTPLSGPAQSHVGADLLTMSAENGAAIVVAASLVVLALARLRDVAERRRSEEALRAAREASEAANKAKSEFLANMSHEIRTPLNGVLGMLELALDSPLSPEQAEYLGTAWVSADSLLGVINDVLDFSKVEAGRVELESAPFNLSKSVGDTVSALALRAHKKGLEFNLSIAPDVPDALIGDPGRFGQVILNLVGNALKFTQQGEVGLRIDLESRDAEGVLLHARVTDTGIGIPQDKQSQIFDAFSQADTSTTRLYGGTGLGLAICSRLIQIMGGRVWVESDAGAGSTFHFTVRFREDPGAAATAEAFDIAPFRGTTVMVVDDNATSLANIERMLREWDMKVSVAPDAVSALSHMLRATLTGHPCSLLVSDVQMPKIDGFALVDRLRKTPEIAATPVIFMSTGGERSQVARAGELGVRGVLTKPVKKEQLYGALRAALGLAPYEDVEAPATRPTSMVAEHRLRILLAEDNAVNQLLAVNLLQKRGHSVEVAGNGRIALEALARDTFDVVLMDAQMPEMGGVEATRIIRERETAANAKRIPVVALTARAMAGDRERFLEAGMDAYLSKPFRRDELYTVVEGFGPRAPKTRSRATPPTLRVVPPGGEGAPEPVLQGAVLDRDSLLDQIEGNHELFTELLGLFQSESATTIATLRQAFATRDRGQIAFSAHALKGAAASISAARTSEAARRVEHMAPAADFDELVRAFQTLEAELSRAQATAKGLVMNDRAQSDLRESA